MSLVSEDADPSAIRAAARGAAANPPGNPGSWTVPIENITREGVDGAVVYVQDGNRDKPGPMLGAAYTALQ